MPRGQERQWKRRRFDETNRVRNRDEVLDRHLHILGVATVAAVPEHVVGRALVVATVEAGRAAPARQAGLQHHAAAEAVLTTRRADHLAGDVGARDMRKRNADPLNAAALPQVEVIERAGAHAHKGFARVGHRLGDVFVAEDVGPSVCVEPNRFHGQISGVRT